MLSYPVFWQSKGQGAGFSPRTKQDCALVCSSLFLQPPRAAEEGRAACAARSLGKHCCSCMRPKLQAWRAPTVHAGAQEPVAVHRLQPLRILHGGPTPHNRGTLLPSLAYPPHLICLTAVSRSLPHHPKSTSRSNFLMLLLDEHQQTPLAFSLGRHFGSI